MNALLIAQRRAQAVGGAVALATVGAQVRQVLILSGVDQVIPAAAGVDEGMGFLTAIQADLTPTGPARHRHAALRPWSRPGLDAAALLIVERTPSHHLHRPHATARPHHGHRHLRATGPPPPPDP
jgi:hypothetical protein